MFIVQVGGEELYLLHKSLKSLGQETRSLEVDLNEALNQVATSRQALKHLEPDIQAIQGRKDLEAKVSEYVCCKNFRVSFRLARSSLFGDLNIYLIRNIKRNKLITKKLAKFTNQ